MKAFAILGAGTVVAAVYIYAVLLLPWQLVLASCLCVIYLIREV